MKIHPLPKYGKSSTRCIWQSAHILTGKSESRREAEGVVSAVEMLRGIGDGEMPDYTGRKVAVIGGGNVAMDVARSAVRLGADRVQIVYRRRKTDMTAIPEEVEGAMEEGCELLELHAPLRIEQDTGKVCALWVQPQVIGQISRGRPAPYSAATEPLRLPCDLVLVAIGQGIESREFENTESRSGAAERSRRWIERRAGQ